MPIDLESLMPAKSMATYEAEKQGLSTAPKRPKHELHKLKKNARARLIAQEFVRNGMNIRQAIHSVTGSNPKSNSNGIMTLLGEGTDTFVDELSKLVDKSDVNRDRAIALLWAMANTSILDFIDDHGHVLPIPELRKLPRVMQVLLSKLDVTSVMNPVRGEDGKIMRDDNGSPYMREEHRVRIELPEKMIALGQLAQIMRWVGPSVLVQNNINIGRIMSDADAKMERANVIYEQARELDQ